MNGFLLHSLKSWSKMVEERRNNMGGCAKARQMGRTCSQFLMGMGESRVMCRYQSRDGTFSWGASQCFQNIFNSYWSDHLTRDRGSANVSKGKVSSFKWNWLVLHARHTDSLLVTYVLIFLEFFFMCEEKFARSN